MLKKIAPAMVLFLVLFAPALGTANEKLDPQPEALIPQSRFSFQPVVEGTVVEHDFVIRNQGDAPLEILHLKTP